MKEYEFNLNQFIKVKLTGEGKKILKEMYNLNNDDLKSFYTDDEYAKFQLWQFMNIFGKYLFNGSIIQPIKKNNIIILEKDLIEKEKEPVIKILKK